MNSAHSVRVLAVLAAALVVVTPRDASAVDLNTVVGKSLGVSGSNSLDQSERNDRRR